MMLRLQLLPTLRIFCDTLLSGMLYFVRQNSQQAISTHRLVLLVAVISCVTGFIPAAGIRTAHKHFSSSNFMLQMISTLSLKDYFYEPKKIRNFSIITHVDHGKSTLADRLLEITKPVHQQRDGENFVELSPLQKPILNPCWRNISDVRLRFAKQMLKLYPERGGFPKVCEDFSQEEHDEAVKKSRKASEAKIFFVNEEGARAEISMQSVWRGLSKHTPKGLPDWTNITCLHQWLPEKMMKLSPIRDGFPKIADDFTQQQLDDAIKGARQPSEAKIPFVNEAGDRLHIDVYDVWRGHSKHLATGLPDWRNLTDLRVSFEEKMLKLYPNRGGFPKIADDYTQEQHDAKIAKLGSPCYTKVPFINDDGTRLHINVYDVWRGANKHLSRLSSSYCVSASMEMLPTPS